MRLALVDMLSHESSTTRAALGASASATTASTHTPLIGEGSRARFSIHDVLFLLNSR